jgi:hypothetical protein
MGHGEEQDHRSGTRERVGGRPACPKAVGNTSLWPEYRGMDIDLRRAVRKAQGRCQQCGKGSGGKSRCVRCSEAHNARKRQAYAAMNREQRRRVGRHRGRPRQREAA